MNSHEGFSGIMKDRDDTRICIPPDETVIYNPYVPHLTDSRTGSPPNIKITMIDRERKITLKYDDEETLQDDLIRLDKAIIGESPEYE